VRRPANEQPTPPPPTAPAPNPIPLVRDGRKTPAAAPKDAEQQVLDLEIDFNPTPTLFRTNQDKAVYLVRTRFQNGDIEVLMALAPGDGFTQPNQPHNLWMILLSNVTIWNKSEKRVSLQFEYQTTLAGPVSPLELTSNGVTTDLVKLAAMQAIPIGLQEHGPGRASSQIPNVLINGLEKFLYMRGPLDIDPSDHKEGVLAFFFQQLDDKDSRVDFANGTLVVTDRLSNGSLAREIGIPQKH
jgi:hypothetical protein